MMRRFSAFMKTKTNWLLMQKNGHGNITNPAFTPKHKSWEPKLIKSIAVTGLKLKESLRKKHF